MRWHHLTWREGAGWESDGDPGSSHLVIYFGPREALADGARYRELRATCPQAHILGCSTGGQIIGDDVVDGAIVAVAMTFRAARIGLAAVTVGDGQMTAREAGRTLGGSLAAPDLAGLFVLSDGLHVNGSELVAGIAETLDRPVPITGGLAGDGPHFQSTLVGADGPPRERLVAAAGFYGDAIRIAHGSEGGWDVFGPRRTITRSDGNVLYELDGEPALDLYERYLGEEDSRDLPSTGLLFPLCVYEPGHPEHNVIRTILGIDREGRSMTFAGDVPEGWVAQLMRGNFDRLATGAAHAARQARPEDGADNAVALIVSCIGRRLLMGQSTADEVEAAAAELGKATHRIGFYSYGEISPHAVSGVCQLHNQTMTVTTISEAA